jgi:predicted aspartyl protease
MSEIYEDTEEKTNKMMHNSAYTYAMSTIPEMFCHTGDIILDGSINNTQIKILVDTGAQVSILTQDGLNKLGLEYLVDDKDKIEMHGITGKESSLGNIWYVDLSINNIEFPITLTVSKMKSDKIDMILGINFLQSYRAQLDFWNKTLKLNDKYVISFNYN